MRKRTLSLILALVLAFSLITGDIVPVFGETTASSEEDKDILYSTPASDDGGNVIVGEYEEGEIIVLYQPDKNASVKESIGNDRSGSDSVEAADLMAMSEDLMDVSEGAAAIEADREDPSQLQADGFSGQNETAVIKLIKSDRYSTEELLKMYRDFPGVLCAEPNYIGHIAENDEIPLFNAEDNEVSVFNEEYINYESINPEGDAAVKDPDLTGYQYAYENGVGGMDVPDWNDPSKMNAEGTVVAIVDSGVDYNHPDLKDVMWDEGDSIQALLDLGGGKYGFNAAWNKGDAPSTDPMDVHHHGTHIAGIIAAAWNDFGVSGIANGAKIMAVRHTDSNGSNNTANTLKAFNYIKTAKEAGVNVVSVNNSWAAENESEVILGYAVRELTDLGIVFCMCASNIAMNNDIFAQTPSTLTDNPGAIIVNASTNAGTRGVFSDYGIRSTHIFSPGADIMSTYPLAMVNKFADMSVLTPIKDANGDTAADEFLGSTTWFNIEPDATSGSTCTVTDGAMQIRNTVLRSHDNLDDITTETTQEAPPTDGYLATVCTLKPGASISSEKTIYFGINAKTTAAGAADNEMLRMYMKTKDGKWDRPAVTPALSAKYEGTCYKLDKGMKTGGSFDLDNIEIRLVAYNASSTFEDIDIDQLWFTDTEIAYNYSSGTSMATPAIAGEVAVLANKYPGESAAKRAARVLAGARLLDNLVNDCITGGIANVRNSLDETTYTPVITELNTNWDGLHLSGFFFGDKDNTEIIIKQGDLTFTTTDESLKVKDVKTLVNGGKEIILSMPQALKAGEVTVKIENKAAAPGRTSYTRIMRLDDPDGFLSPYYPQLPAPVDLKEVSPTKSLVAWNGSLIVTGCGSVTNVPESWICTPAGSGSWKQLPVAVDMSDNGNVITWNQKLLYINKTGELCIHDPLTGDVDKKVLIMNDRRITEKEACVLYFDGERVILAWTPITNGNADNTQIWEVKPANFKANLLGTLKGAYGSSSIEYCAPVIAHTTDTDGKTNAYYVFGLDEKTDDDKAEMERITIVPSFVSDKVTVKYPEDGEMIFIQDGKDKGGVFQLYTGCAFAGDNGHGAMMLTGMFRTNDSYAGNAVIYNDNFFINLADNDLKVIPSEQKVSASKVFNSVLCAYEGRAYIMGIQESNSRSLAFAYTPVPTWPAYGDQVQTDPTVKVKKLTLSKTKVTLEQGKTEKLSAAPAFKDPGTYAAVVFASSNTNVATVDVDGTVHAKNAGTAVITASCGDKTASCTVTVDAKATPKLNKTETTLKEGEKDLLILNDAIVNGKEKITWKSSNSKIVTVNKGLLMAKKAGTADVYAIWKSGKETLDFTCKVTVEDITVPKAASDDKAVKLSVGKSSVKLNRKDTTEITAKLSGADLTKRTIDFKSLNPNVVNFGEAGDSVTLSGNALVKTDITGQGAGIAYIVVESYDPSVEPAVKNRKLVKVTVNAPAESIEFTGVSNSSVQFLKGANTINMKTGSVTVVSYKLSPEVCTDFSKVKWSVGKGGTVTVKNGIITAKKVSSKDSNGNYIPSIVTAACGGKKMDIRVIVE